MQGGSTITQQFVKNALTAQGDRSVFQKMRESALAYHLERNWSKQIHRPQHLGVVAGSVGRSPDVSGEGKVTICLTVDDEVAVPEKFRLQKPATILEVTTPITGVVCILRTVATRGMLPFHERLAGYAADLLLPSPLYAALITKTTKPTGGAGSFSPFQGGNPEAAVVTWVHPPADGTLSGGDSEHGSERAGNRPGDGGEPHALAEREASRSSGWRTTGRRRRSPERVWKPTCPASLSSPTWRHPRPVDSDIFVETHPTATGCSVDPDVANFDPVAVAAPARIVVRP